ncbi:creatininase family protein [Qingshengfaniella alkalisoli]|uniref:Creatininase family protein n=1 Tax=Qingshengfaniella alkalisoli TaxID=2599296 RepID=A0A5B8IXC5_9RHOB|nr:creatininase family protein [Qingshengfaniella alkalisoli]QDY70354.1 creatininase family protein [Qingshengfaniella alkalisoli]
MSVPLHLARMTQDEAARHLRENPVILLPLGSQEGQGPHVPMGDYRLSEALAERVSARSGALVAPALPFGYADFFRDYPGGMQLRPATFTALLTDMLTSLLDHGLTRLLILNGHSTNEPLIAQVARELRRQRGAVVASVDLWPSVPASLLRDLFGEVRVRGHGAEPVSSVAMHLLPGEAHALDEAPTDRRGRLFDLPLRGVSGANFEGLRVNMPVMAGEIAPDGLLGGDATRGSDEAGAAITEDLVNRLCKLVTHFQEADPPSLAPGKEPVP